MNERPRTWRDLAIEQFADEWAAADARTLQVLIESESYRMLAVTAMAALHKAANTIKNQQATIAALKDELRRYTAGQVRS